MLKDSMAHQEHNDAVLVTGGSGFVGRRLIKCLARASKSVVSIYHHRFTEPMVNVYPVCSDLSSVELLAAPLRGVENVVYLAWQHTFLGPNAVEFDPVARRGSVNINILSNMIAAMEKAGTRRIVFLSAVGASPDAENTFLQEKYWAEFCILNSQIPEKVIIRSSLIFGENLAEDRFLRAINALMRFRWVYPLPKLSDRIAPIAVNDICGIIMAALKKEIRCDGTVVEVFGKTQYNMDQLFKAVSQKMGGASGIPIGGMLGNALANLLDPGKKQGNLPRLRDYLAINTNMEQTENDSHPIIRNFLDHQPYSELLPGTT